MNIFVLDTDPAIAASYHCDQHIHKLILEAVQMLSTAAHVWFPKLKPYIYEPAYVNHPCTQWVKQNKANALWLATLAWELDEIRQSLGSNEHASCGPLSHIMSYLDGTEGQPDPFQFVGSPYIDLRYSKLSVPEKYQEYYKLKYRKWLDTARPMSYINRPLPPFLSEFADTIPHG